MKSFNKKCSRLRLKISKRNISSGDLLILFPNYHKLQVLSIELKQNLKKYLIPAKDTYNTRKNINRYQQ